MSDKFSSGLINPKQTKTTESALELEDFVCPRILSVPFSFHFLKFSVFLYWTLFRTGQVPSWKSYTWVFDSHYTQFSGREK